VENTSHIREFLYSTVHLVTDSTNCKVIRSVSQAPDLVNSAGIFASQRIRISGIKKQLHLFPKLPMLPSDNSKKSEKEKREIPRRRKPVVQEQGHRVLKLQAELEEQGLQKLDNQ